MPTNRSRKGFPSIRANRLESRCFGARDGETPATARDSNEFERGAVRAICLAASEQGPSRPRDETGLAHDLQLHFAFALLGLPVECLDGGYDCRQSRKAIFTATWFPTSIRIHAVESGPSEDASPGLIRPSSKNGSVPSNGCSPGKTPISGPASSEQTTSPAA